MSMKYSGKGLTKKANLSFGATQENGFQVDWSTVKRIPLFSSLQANRKAASKLAWCLED